MLNANNNRWGVVIASVVILMCLGVAYSWGVFLIPIDQEMGWGRTKISFAVSILLLVFSVFMSISGLLEKKIGPHFTASIGGILIGLGWIGASFSQTTLWLYLFYGIIAGIGTGLCYMPALSCGIKWFPEKKGLITGIIVFGFGFGTAFLSPLAIQLINCFGWRTTMLSYGIAFGCIILLAAQYLKIPDINPQQNQIENRDEANYTPIQMMKTSVFKILFFTYFLAMVAGMLTIGHISAFLSDLQFSAIQAACSLTILAIFNGLGRVSFGYFSDILGRKTTLITLFLIMGISMVLLNVSHHLFFIYMITALIGLCFGGFLVVYPSLIADYFGVVDFSINYGIIFIGYGIGCFVGPILGGYIYDLTKHYMIAFNIAALCAFLGSGLIFWFCKKPKK